VAIEAKDLTLQLLTRMAIVPYDGVPVQQGATDGGDWSLLTIPTNKGKLALKLSPGGLNFLGAHQLSTNGNGGALNCYFLRWLKRRVCRLELGNDSDVFWTAGINGCSVIAMGDPTKPTVFHGGTEGALAKQDDLPAEKEIAKAASESSEKFWTLLITTKLVPKAWEDKNWAGIHRQHYINDGSGTTPAAKAFIEKAKAQHKKDKDPIEWDTRNPGTPWGSVFGFKKSGRWAFYLQKNVSFWYSNTATKKKYAASFPFEVIQFYPKGQEKVNIIDPAPTKIPSPFEVSEWVVERKN
jgi:hypothetical protein